MTAESGFGDSLRPGRILVADPDAESRQLYHDCFESLGCDVVEATDGRDALMKALIRVPTLILTELWLPHLDGFALCEILRKDSSTRETPILIVTADARPEVLQHGRDAGADVVLVKPVSPEVIFAESHRLIDESRRLRPNMKKWAKTSGAQPRGIGRCAKPRSSGAPISGERRRGHHMPHPTLSALGALRG